MAGTQPVAMYALRVPPGDILVPAVPDLPAMLRVTMAAIDPSQEPELDASDDKQKPRATLKVVRIPEHMLDDDDSDEDDDEDDDSELEDMNGGPSKRSKKTQAGGDDEDMDDEESDDDEEEAAAAQALLAKVMKADKKGKSKALDGDDDDEDEDELDALIEDGSDESLEMDEAVICTLDPERVCQQPLDFHLAEGERVFFKVSGNLSVHLTGNYVMPLDDPSDDDDDDYDLSPDEEEELDGLDALVDGDDESDELDDLDDPRIMELDSDEEDEKAKKAIAAAINAKAKGKNKRPAEDDEDEASLDNIMAKSLKQAAEAPTADDTKKLSKAEKKKAKKLKNNEGEAATPPQPEKKDPVQTNGESSKKVQFAKNLEQGPTPSKADEKKKPASLGVKDVQGVTVDDRKAGTGPQAKKGSRLELRYIGKLDNGKVFDSNKAGKPFSLKLGAGDVIKGWELGLQGIATGGERRMIIPAHLAYGKKSLPGIPANSKLTFDVKCLSVK